MQIFLFRILISFEERRKERERERERENNFTNIRFYECYKLYY